MAQIQVLKLLRFRLVRQHRTLRAGLVDRFLALSERFRADYPGLVNQIASDRDPAEKADPEYRSLLFECQNLMDSLVPLMEKQAVQIKGQAIRVEIERKIQEFIAKKDEP